MYNHVEAVWMFFMILLFLFIIFTGSLAGYHTYLMFSGQTTWEHMGRARISYLKCYKQGQMPFYESIKGNFYSFFCHGNVP